MLSTLYVPIKHGIRYKGIKTSSWQQQAIMFEVYQEHKVKDKMQSNTAVIALCPV